MQVLQSSCHEMPMELCSLHPFEESSVQEFVQAITGSARSQSDVIPGNSIAAGKRSLARIERGEGSGVYEMTHALGSFLAERQPSFTHPGLSLSTWEARVDRGAGMLLRPPSRLLIDAGLDPAIARKLPIRLEMSRGMMGGAYVPARLVGQFDQTLELRLERTLRRLSDAEWDGVAVLGLMIEMVAYCRSNGYAIYEAMDVVAPDGVGSNTFAQVITADKKRLDKSLRVRLEAAAKPPKKPGLLARLTRRGNTEEPGTGQ